MVALSESWRERSSPPVVTATGAVNGLGFNSHQTWAFWRAEITPFAATPFRLDNGERATMVQVRSLPPGQHGVERQLALARHALGQIEGPLAALPDRTKLGASICVSEYLRDRSDPYFGAQRTIIERQLTRWFLERFPELSSPRFFAYGHAGFAHALYSGCTALMEREIDALVVGGVESYYDPLIVDILLEQERIFDQVRSDAFVPGEGAAFALIVRRNVARRAKLTPTALVDTVAMANEPGPLLSDEACTGRGLAQVVRSCTDRLKDEHRLLEWMLGDVTNESYRTLELQLALPRALAPGGLDTAGRTYREVADDLVMDFPSECWGDLGAASMPTAMIVATEAFRRGRPSAVNCLITGTSTGRERGAMLLDALEQPMEDACL